MPPKIQKHSVSNRRGQRYGFVLFIVGLACVILLSSAVVLSRSGVQTKLSPVMAGRRAAVAGILQNQLVGGSGLGHLRDTKDVSNKLHSVMGTLGSRQGGSGTMATARPTAKPWEPKPEKETCLKSRRLNGRVADPSDQASEPSIIPRPVEMHCVGAIADGFVLDAKTLLFHAAVSDATLQSFRRLFTYFFRFQLQQTPTRGRGRIELVENSTLPQDGYTLKVVEGHGDSALVIGVSKRAGHASILYALQSLRQLLHLAALGSGPNTPPSRPRLPLRLPSCSIVDWPRHHWRGVMLDVARHFFDVGQVKRLLSIMAFHKLNVLHLHLSDDQGWRVEVRSRPELGTVGGTRGASLNLPQGDWNGERVYDGKPYITPKFFTRAEVKDLIAHAREFAIDVVPEIDVPAHTAALIIAARSIGKNVGSVELHEGCAGRQGQANLTAPPNCLGGTHGMVLPTKVALEYVLAAVSEVADLFPSKYFHLGGDEADQFRDSVYSSAEAEKLKTSLGLSSSTALQGYMTNEVHKLLRAKGKTVIAWDETHLGLEDYKSPEDMVVMWWRDFDPQASWENVQGLGHKMILAPQGKMYLDIYQMEPHKASCFRVQEGTTTLWSTYSTWGDMLDAQNVLGVHAPLWTEQLQSTEALEYQMFPRGAAVAEIAWTARGRTDFADFQKRWHVHKNRLAFMGVQYYDGPYTGAPTD